MRFDFATGRDSIEPTLLIKASTLLLKYLVLGVRVQLVLARIEDHLLYGLRVYDDPDKPALLWSVLERDEEKSAITALARGEQCQTFLFDEVALNVAQSAIAIDFAGADLMALVQNTATGRVDHDALKVRASAIFDRFDNETKSGSEIVVADIRWTKDWERVSNTLITNGASPSLSDHSTRTEGYQRSKYALY